MVRLPDQEKLFWLDLNVRLAEFCELPLNDQKHARKIYNLLRASEQTWYRLLIKDFNAGSGGLFSFLLTQYHQDKTFFCQIFALKKFSDTIEDMDMIINKAKDVLGEEYPIYEVLTEEDPRG